MSAMNKSKAKGTKAETKVLRFIRERSTFPVSRRALSGSNDQGDLLIQISQKTFVVVEVKTGKMTSNPNRNQLTEWMRQADIEAENSRKANLENTYLPALVVVRYNRKIQDADVYTPQHGSNNLSEPVHLWLDEFVERL